MYIIQLTETSWIADWEGDPGRTLKLQSAKIFDTKASAERFLKKSRKKNEHRDFSKSEIAEVEITYIN